MSGKTVLVVEDNPITRKMLAYTLTSEGYEVLEAADGRTALALAGRRPDLILSDYVLPDMDGVQLLGALRSLPGAADAPAAVITGMVSKLADMRSSVPGPTSFLPKPIEPERLLEFVRSHLGGRSSAIGAGRRVLVVDDEEVSRKLTAMYLEDAGFLVETAESGAEALEKAGRAPPDAILSDVLMPGMDGFLLCRAFRSDARLARVPVVLLSSAYVDAPDQKLAHDMGASALVPRGGELESAIQALADALSTGVTPETAPAADLSAGHAERVQRQLEKQVARNDALLRQGAIQAAALSVVRGLAEALARPDDLPGMLADVLVHCLDAAGLSSGLLYLPDAEGQLQLRAQSGVVGAAREAAVACFGRPEVLRRVLSGGQSVAWTFGDAEASADLRALAAGVGYASVLIVPFVVQRQHLGGLILASDAQDLSNSSWMGFASALAVQFGQTIALGQHLARGAATELRYRSLMEAANDAILILDSRFHIVEANRAALALFGLERDALLGRPSLSLVAPGAQEAAQRTRRELLDRGAARAEGRELLRGDGSRVVVDVSLSLVRLGDETATIAILRDITERMRAEAALADSEARHRLMFAANPLPIWIFDRETLRFLDVNEAAVNQYGYSRDEFLKMTIKDIRPPEDLPALHENVRKPGAPPPPGGWRHFKKDGTLIDVEIAAQDTELGGRPARVVVARDVTEKKRVERERRENQQLLQALLRGAQALIYVKDVQGRFILSNSRSEAMAPLSGQDIVGKTDYDFFPQDLADRFRANDVRVLETQEPLEVEEEIPQRDGVHTYLSLKYPLLDSGGSTYAICGISTDITDRKRAEAERARLSQAVDQAIESIVITDLEGTIVYVNPAFERISGYARAEAVGRTPRIVKSGRHDAAFYQSLWATLSKGDVWRGRFVNRRKDGTLYEEEATISPVRGLGGEPINYVSVQRDLTHEQRLEAQLVQSQKMEAIGQLAGGVAHDFNNLLGVVIGFAELLRRDMGPEHPGQRRLEQIHKAADRAAALTRQLLAFSRKQVLEPRVLDLNHVVSDTEKMLRRLIGEDVQLVTVFGSALGRVRVDPGQVEQIIVNLAVNARDAMPKGGRLIIETSNATLDETYTRDRPGVAPGEYVLVTVSDTGHGMDSATMAKVFEPFFTTKDPGKGTGLGLATVYGIVKQSGGHIAVYSEPSRGTTFKAYFPRVDAELDRPVVAPTQPPPRGTETVLLLEDAEALRTIVREILEDAGYSVIDGATTEEAVARAAQHVGPIHVVLSDVVMPRANGPEVAAQLKASRPQIRALFMSGYTDEAIGHHGVLEPGCHFIQKPFTSDALQRKMREVLDAPSP